MINEDVNVYVFQNYFLEYLKKIKYIQKKSSIFKKKSSIFKKFKYIVY
jgi:hypothetical protein